MYANYIFYESNLNRCNFFREKWKKYYAQLRSMLQYSKLSLFIIGSFHYSLDGLQLVKQHYMKRDTPKETKWIQYQSAFMVNLLSNQSESCIVFCNSLWICHVECWKIDSTTFTYPFIGSTSYYSALFISITFCTYLSFHSSHFFSIVHWFSTPLIVCAWIIVVIDGTSCWQYHRIHIRACA